MMKRHLRLPKGEIEALHESEVLIIESRQTSNGACSQGLALGGLQHLIKGRAKRRTLIP
jgi:hypothetical protein